MQKKKPANPLDHILARLHAEQTAEKKVNLSDLSLLDFVPAVSPRYARPEHLKAIVPHLEKSFTGPEYFTFSAPPRHGKSSLVFHFIAQFIAKYPHLNVAYCSYSATFAERKSDEIRAICARAGVEFDQRSKARDSWRTTQGGGLLARGPGGPLTGEGLHLAVVDDPYRSRQEAESATIRENIMDWWTSVLMTRLEPGASVFCTHCIAEGEPILMADGSWKPVESVRPGDIVISRNQSGDYVPAKVTASRQSGSDPIYKVRTGRKSTRTNGRHPFLLESGAWVRAEDLRVGDNVTVFDDATGTEGCDPEYAWLLGFMLGDGWVTEWSKNNNRSRASRAWCVCVAKGVHPATNERVLDALERFFGRRPKETKFGYYRLDSSSAGRQLQQAGITGGAWGKRIPQWVFRLTPDLKREFLRGYIEADGTATRNCIDGYILASVSCDLIDDARKLAISCGIKVCSIKSSSQMVHAPNSAAPKLSTIFKVNINFNGPPASVEVVEAIEYDSIPTPVYDLTVEDTENFVCNGFVVHNTRWHPDDLIGKLTNDEGWPHINLPAINADGLPLWPTRYDLKALEKRRKDVHEYDWASMFQGEPRPRGGAVFNGTNTYTEKEFSELKGLKYTIGLDMAYTSKTHSDFSVAVVLATDADDNHYIVDVRRKQCEASAFATVLRELRYTYSSAPIYWYVGGTEKAVAETFRNSFGIPVKDIPAREDKFVRAQSVAACWNSGRIRLPLEHKPWLDSFVTEVLLFTGLGDKHDDCVDALAAAFVPNSRKRVFRGMRDNPLPF